MQHDVKLMLITLLSRNVLNTCLVSWPLVLVAYADWQGQNADGGITSLLHTL
jgi:hypothetical protein